MDLLDQEIDNLKILQQKIDDLLSGGEDQLTAERVRELKKEQEEISQEMVILNLMKLRKEKRQRIEEIEEELKREIDILHSRENRPDEHTPEKEENLKKEFNEKLDKQIEEFYSLENKVSDDPYLRQNFEENIKYHTFLSDMYIEELRNRRSTRIYQEIDILEEEKNKVIGQLIKEEEDLDKEIRYLNLMKIMPKDLASIIFNDSQEWKDLDIKNMSTSEKKRHKDMIEFYIRQQIPDFKEEITDLDLQTFIENDDLGVTGAFYNSIDKGSLNLVRYYLSYNEEYLQSIEFAMFCEQEDITIYLIDKLKETDLDYIRLAMEKKLYKVFRHLITKAKKSLIDVDLLESLDIRRSEDQTIKDIFNEVYEGS